MTFGYYIRNILEISQFILISSVFEIYGLNTSEFSRLVSFIFAILMVICYCSILGFVNYLIFSNYEIDEDKHNKLEEFFVCLQENKKSRFYVTMLLLRRLLYVTLLITLTSLSSKILIGIMILLQFIYCTYIVFIRPYKDTKSNIIEILNEAYFSVFLVTLMILNTQSEWSTLKTNIYVWILVSNSMVVFLIIFVYTIKSLIIWLRSKCQKNSNMEDNTVKITPLSGFNHESVIYPHQEIHNRRILDIQTTVSTNQLKEERKYSVQDNLSEIKIIPQKDWS